MNADKLPVWQMSVDEVKALIETNRQQADRIAELEKQIKPLSDEEIVEIAGNLQESSQPYNINFARAIEERHGIK